MGEEEEEQQDVLVAPADAPGASEWENLGNFQVWAQGVTSGGGCGSRHGVWSPPAPKTCGQSEGADKRRGWKPEAR